MVSSDELTQHKYTDLLICLNKNYVNYSKNKFGYDIEGTLSLSEQMADTFGILASFKAYLNKLSSMSLLKNDHKLLPGLNFNQEQLFFIRYSQSYCRKRKITNVKDFEQYHVIHEYRSFQPRLIPEFNTVFKCNEAHGKSVLKTCSIFKIPL